jgi:GntR family transcriptional regulator
MLTKEQRLVPLYYQVQQTLAGRIRRGEYRPGSLLPSESELSRELAVSRVTVREALRALTDDRLVIKAQGRGTFVADPLPSTLSERAFTGYLEDLYDELPRVTVRHVEIARIPVGEELRSALALPNEDHELVRVKRARHIDGAPYAFTVNFLPLTLGAELDDASLRRMPIVRFLEDVLKTRIESASETLRADAADPEIARWLEVPVLSPVMYVRRVLFAPDHRPLQVVDSYYRSDRFHYAIQLVRVKKNGRPTWSPRDREPGAGKD